jgi:hypothetical protein
VGKDPNRSVLEDLIGLCENGLGLLLILYRYPTLATGLGYKDLVASHVGRGSVMAPVGYPPGVVGNEESRVEHPADGVVEGLRGRVGLMTAWIERRQCEANGRKRAHTWHLHSCAMTQMPVHTIPWTNQ